MIIALDLKKKVWAQQKSYSSSQGAKGKTNRFYFQCSQWLLRQFTQNRKLQPCGCPGHHQNDPNSSRGKVKESE